jgi:serine/threonine protein phosphatase 1
MTHRRIIIGDVHGHYRALMQLLEAIAPTDQDQVYFLGDLVDRGPHSAQVVEFVIQMQYPCLLGNHEQMLLNAIGSGEIDPNFMQSWLFAGGHNTLESYNDHIPQDHIDWMKVLPVYLDLGDIWLVHAGIDPKLPFSQQTKSQFCWIREDFHRSTRPYFPDKLIVTGHTITFTFKGVKPGQLVAGAGWIGIETGAYHPNSGWFRALDVDQQQVYQFNCHTKNSRILPLDEAVVRINPTLMEDKSPKKSFFSRMMA